mgnify:CR=1 FL=1
MSFRPKPAFTQQVSPKSEEYALKLFRLRSLRCLARPCERQRGGVIVRIALFVLGLAAATAFGAHWYVHQRPLPMTADRIEFRVPAGAGVRAIAQSAQAAGIGKGGRS